MYTRNDFAVQKWNFCMLKGHQLWTTENVICKNHSSIFQKRRLVELCNFLHSNMDTIATFLHFLTCNLTISIFTYFATLHDPVSDSLTLNMNPLHGCTSMILGHGNPSVAFVLLVTATDITGGYISFHVSSQMYPEKTYLLT